MWISPSNIANISRQNTLYAHQNTSFRRKQYFLSISTPVFTEVLSILDQWGAWSWWISVCVKLQRSTSIVISDVLLRSSAAKRQKLTMDSVTQNLSKMWPISEMSGPPCGTWWEIQQWQQLNYIKYIVFFRIWHLLGGKAVSVTKYRQCSFEESRLSSQNEVAVLYLYMN